MPLVSGGGGGGGGLPLTGGTLTGPLVLAPTNPATIPLQIRASYNNQSADFFSILNTDTGQDIVGVNSGANLAVFDLVTGFNVADLEPSGGVVTGKALVTLAIQSGALPTTTAFVSGTGKQISSARDVDLVVPVTFNPTAGAAATCVVALSPDNVTYTNVGTETEPAGVAFDGTVHLIGLHVPFSWYVKLTVVNATIGTGTYY